MLPDPEGNVWGDILVDSLSRDMHVRAIGGGTSAGVPLAGVQCKCNYPGTLLCAWGDVAEWTMAKGDALLAPAV